MTGTDAFWDGALWIAIAAAIALLALLVYAWREPRRRDDHLETPADSTTGELSPTRRAQLESIARTGSRGKWK